MISVNEAKEILKKNSFAGNISESEIVNSNGYYLAEDVYAACNVPRFDNSAMDGYGISFDPSQSDYKITSTIAAGEAPGHAIKNFEAIRIFTGAQVPESVDTIVQQEICFINDGKLSFDPSKVKVGDNIRITGSQTKVNDLILNKGTKITPHRIALLASAGIRKVQVFMPPSVAVIVTGSEIAEEELSCPSSMIYDSNGPSLLASLEDLNIRKRKLFHSRDEFVELNQIVAEALNDFDMLIITGGISVGDYDHVKSVLKEQKVDQLIYKVLQKPGKPFFAGKREDKWIFGLPGNPAAVLTCFNQYVKNVINSISGNTLCWENSLRLKLLNGFSKKVDLTQFVKGKFENDSVQILKGQDSFDLSAFASANCMVELCPGKDHFLQGDMANVYPLK